MSQQPARPARPPTVAADTDPWADQLIFDHWRTAPAWQKLQEMEALMVSALLLAQAGIRMRHPEATDEEVRAMALELRNRA